MIGPRQPVASIWAPFALVAWAAMPMLWACSGPVAGGKADGAVVFAQACAACHGEQGKPSASMAAQLGVRDLTSKEFRARATLPLIRFQVQKGSQDKRMPALEHVLTPAQIEAVAQYVLEMAAPPNEIILEAER